MRYTQNYQFIECSEGSGFFISTNFYEPKGDIEFSMPNN